MEFCSNCGNKVDNGSKFCQSCGQKIESKGLGNIPNPAQETPVQPIQAEHPKQEEASVQGSYQASYTPPAQQSYTPPAQQSYSAQNANAQGAYAQPTYAAAAPKQKKPLNKKMLFIIGGAVLAIILAIVLISALGGKGDKNTASDPNLGLYTATTAEMWGMEMDISDLFEKGVSVELKENGKCDLNVNGDKGSGKWTLAGDKFHVKGCGVECDGTLSKGVMVWENVLDMGVTLTFEKEGGFSADSSADTSGVAGNITDAIKPDGAADASDLQKQWNGTWYGCMYVSEATGDFADIPDNLYDAYMVVNVDSSGKGQFDVYFANVDEAFASANCEAKESGLYAIDGTVAGGVDMYAYNWMFLPMPDYPDQYTMGDVIEDGDSTFDFTLFMKQWGGSWQKEIDSDFAIVPPSVDSYSAAIANGELPPVGFAPVGYEGTAAASGSDDSSEDPDDQTNPEENEDYGKTTADADGIVPFDVLKEVFTWLEYQTSYEGGYQRPTYDEIAEKLGTNGFKAHPDSWKDDYHVYEWVTTGDDFLLLSFKVQADGSETWNSSSWSSSLKD